jgi:SNF2 family DNA or RNA helicase
MGLGKTFSCISLLHCILNNPVLASTSRWKQKPIRTVLIVVPVNTIANWEAEFDNWTGNLHPSVRVINLGSVEKSARRRNIRKWTTKGGILLISDKTFLRAAKDFCEVRDDCFSASLVPLQPRLTKLLTVGYGRSSSRLVRM